MLAHSEDSQKPAGITTLISPAAFRYPYNFSLHQPLFYGQIRIIVL